MRVDSQFSLPPRLSLDLLAKIGPGLPWSPEPLAWFTSPFSKAAEQCKSLEGLNGVKFTRNGKITKLKDLTKRFATWLGLKPRDILRRDLQSWLSNGDFTVALRDALTARLARHQIPEHALINQPLCRLLRLDQVRFDARNRIPYSLTPAEQQAMRHHSRTGTQPDAKTHRDLAHLQGTFWSLPEPLQSLVAMYDSDLGRRNGSDSRISKEFLRVSSQVDGTSYTPHELNQYSAFRYWATPEIFAASVLPMLVWKPLLTGFDLYNRPVPGDSVQERSSYYLVAINTFNSAKYRTADYPHLLHQLWGIAMRMQERPSLQKKLRVESPQSILMRLASARFEAEERARGSTPVRPNTAHSLPVGSHDIWTNLSATRAYDLFEPYQQGKSLSPLHVRLFLRDRCIELILWSYLQAEIRSIGSLPLENLYSLTVKRPFVGPIEELATFADEKHELAPTNREKQFRNRLFSNTLNAFELRQVFGGRMRSVFDGRHLYRSNRALLQDDQHE